MTPLRVLVVGYGSMGQRHAAHALALGHDVTVFDPQQTVPRTLYVDDWRHAHVVVIASPARFHAAHLARALANRQHAFIEKPLAISVGDATDGCLAWATAGLTTQVGYNWRFSPVLQSIKAHPPIWEQATFWIHCDMADWPGHDYADALLECSHEIDLALWLLGPATLIRATVNMMRTSWDLDLAHTSGACSRVIIDVASHTYERGFTLRGPQRLITYAWDRDQHVARVGDGRGVIVEPSSVLDTYRDELAHFLVCAAKGDPSACALPDGLAVLAICDAARRFALSA